MELRGVPAAPGIAVGPAWRHVEGGAGREPVLDVHAAAERASGELTALAARVHAHGRADEARIFEAQAMMAVDPLLLEGVEARLTTLRVLDPSSVAAAVEAVANGMADALAALPDAVLAARATDVRDVGARIARIVAGRATVVPETPSIAIADDLAPSVAAEIPDGMLLGVALERGSATSHAAILARALDIPAVVAVPGLLAAVDAAAAGAAGPLVIGLDGEAGRVIPGPDADSLAQLAAAAQRRRAAGVAARALRGEPGRTADGHRVPLLANIGRPEDADRACDAGAEGVGLFRTEFLFVGRGSAPTEDEQVAAYRAVFDAFGTHPVVVRTLDIGGDKPVPYLRFVPEANPFLGVRGLRLAYEDREMFLAQARALARAGAGARSVPRLMAPMVATLEDVELVRAMVNEALAQLDGAGVERASRIEVGIMIEIPSACLMARELARRVDFFSVGSNDLTQYVLAMDRTHPALATAADALHPAVLRAIRMAIDAAHEAGIDIAVCGELAGDPAGALVLTGLGIDELSMDAGRLDAVRVALRGVALAPLQALADDALRAETAGQVRALVAALGAALGPAPEPEISAAGRPA